MIKSEWTLNEEKTLIALVTSGKTKRQTAEAMGRTPASITRKIQRMARECFVRLPRDWDLDKKTTGG